MPAPHGGARCLLSKFRLGSYTQSTKHDSQRTTDEACRYNSMHDSASVHAAGLPTHTYALYTDSGMLRLGLTVAQNGVWPYQAHLPSPNPMMRLVLPHAVLSQREAQPQHARVGV